LPALEPETTVVAAFDNDAAGHKMARGIKMLTRRLPHLYFSRDRPARAKDWNEILQHVERDVILLLPKGPRDRAGPER
jgi:DNA primase